MKQTINENKVLDQTQIFYDIACKKAKAHGMTGQELLVTQNALLCNKIVENQTSLASNLAELLKNISALLQELKGSPKK